MEAIPKSDIKSVIKSNIRFEISIKLTTWIGHYARGAPKCAMNFNVFWFILSYSDGEMAKLLSF